VEQREFDSAISEFAVRYSELFERFAAAGWRPDRRVAAEAVEREPHWQVPFPMHELAGRFLGTFCGIEGRIGSYFSLRFGFERAKDAAFLMDTDPYDFERLVLKEDVPAKDTPRPPAFPIGEIHGWVLFLREDWSTIAVTYKWRDVQLAPEPFELIEAFRSGSRHIWDDPVRHFAIDDADQVPTVLVGGVWDA
jgi:hypothetical protein